MLNFELKALNELKEKLHEQFPFPLDFAQKDISFVSSLMDEFREKKRSFSELSLSEFNYIYQIAECCTEEEFNSLKAVFPLRITANLFYIGWNFCQIHADAEKAISLFSDTCNWMKKHRKEEYEKTLIGRVGLPWEELFKRTSELMRIEKLPVQDFCSNYNLLPHTLFCHRLFLDYFSRCEKDELIKYENEFAEMISTAKAEFLRPAIKNYTAKINYQDIPDLINDAISNRLSLESGDETLGISPNMLQNIRQKRFAAILEGFTNDNEKKIQLYISIAGKIKSIQLLNKGFFAIHFSNYVVVDCIDWKSEAYAYEPPLYQQILANWTEKDYPENFWPAIEGEQIADAHDQILGIAKSGVIKLNFSTFDILYTKDLLTITRY